MVLPGIPRIKRPDAVKAFGLDPEALPPIRHAMHKYLLMGEAVQRAPDAVPLQALYVIHQRRNDTSDPNGSPGSLANELLRCACAIRPSGRFVRGLGQEGPNFMALARLQSSIPLAVLPLPSGIDTMQTWLSEQNLLTAAVEAEGPSAQDEKQELRR